MEVSDRRNVQVHMPREAHAYPARPLAWIPAFSSNWFHTLANSAPSYDQLFPPNELLWHADAVIKPMLDFACKIVAQPSFTILRTKRQAQDKWVTAILPSGLLSKSKSHLVQKARA